MRSKTCRSDDPLMVSNDVPEQAWDDVRQASVHREQWKILARELETQNWKELQNVAEIPESLKA